MLTAKDNADADNKKPDRKVCILLVTSAVCNLREKHLLSAPSNQKDSTILQCDWELQRLKLNLYMLREILKLLQIWKLKLFKLFEILQIVYRIFVVI